MSLPPQAVSTRSHTPAWAGHCTSRSSAVSTSLPQPLSPFTRESTLPASWPLRVRCLPSSRPSPCGPTQHSAKGQGGTQVLFTLKMKEFPISARRRLASWPLRFLLTHITSLQTHPLDHVTMAFPTFAAGSISLHYRAGVMEISSSSFCPMVMRLHTSGPNPQTSMFPRNLGLGAGCRDWAWLRVINTWKG